MPDWADIRQYGKSIFPLNCKKQWIEASLETEHLRRIVKGKRIIFPQSVKYVVYHCGTNNLDNNESKAIKDTIIKTGKVFQEKSVVNIIFNRSLSTTLEKI